MKYLLFIIILLAIILSAGCIKSEILEKPLPDTSKITENIEISTPIATPIPTPTQTPNYEKIQYCKEKYPDIPIYNSTTDRCEPDHEKDCVEAYTGSHYDASIGRCAYPYGYKVNTEKVNIEKCAPPDTQGNSKFENCEMDSYNNWYEYCARKYPGTHFSDRYYQCVYDTIPPSNGEPWDDEKCRTNYPGTYYHPIRNRCEPVE